MSVTSALAGALSGLSATSRQAEILSSNVANAATPGYARRQLSLGSAVLAGQGQGVQVLGITRDVAERPDKAPARAEVTLIAYHRLMFVVSCSISSTVWITFAFDE